MLRPGGSLMVMVYYAYSYRRWMQARAVKRCAISVSEGHGVPRGGRAQRDDREKWDYDHSSRREQPRRTPTSSRSSRCATCCATLLDRFRWKLRNINQEPPFEKRTRERTVGRRAGRICAASKFMRRR